MQRASRILKCQQRRRDDDATLKLKQSPLPAAPAPVAGVDDNGVGRSGVEPYPRQYPSSLTAAHLATHLTTSKISASVKQAPETPAESRKIKSAVTARGAAQNTLITFQGNTFNGIVVPAALAHLFVLST